MNKPVMKYPNRRLLVNSGCGDVRPQGVLTYAQSPRYLTIWWVGVCLFIAFLVAVLGGNLFSLGMEDGLSAGILVFFTMISVLLAYKLVQQRPQLVLSPMPWFLLASGAYFGFGPLLYYFGAEQTKKYCQMIFPVNNYDILFVTLLNGGGMLLVFGTWLWRTKRMVHIRNLRFQLNNMIPIILVFYLFGLPPNVITILSKFGIVDFIVPGFFAWLSLFTSAGLILLTMTAFRHGGMWWLVLGFMLALGVLSAMVEFSKYAIILSILPFVLGYMLHRQEASSLWIVLPLMLALYLASNIYVTYARSESPYHSASFSTRLDLSQSFFGSNFQLNEGQGQNWWFRLNYANVQKFAMQEYDRGFPGDTFALALLAPIPRIIWKDKPVIESGYKFYRELTGGSTASFGMGFFAEAYWNGGWLLFILSSIAIGWLFGDITLLVAKHLAIADVWILPIAFLWMKNGCRVDGWVHTEIVGPAVFTFLFVLMLRLFKRRKFFFIRFRTRLRCGRLK